MKKFCVLLVLAILFSFCSCTTDEMQENPHEALTEQSQIPNTDMSFVEKKIKTTEGKTLDKVITSEYDEQEMLADLYLNCSIDIENLALSRPATDLTEFNDRYPVECLRKSDDSIYAVFKTKQKGYMYVFFKDNSKQNYTYRGFFYITKNLTLKDFDTIQVGDIIETAYSIEPAIKSCVMVQREKLVSELDKDTVLAINILATDGLFKVNYEVNSGLIESIEIRKNSEIYSDKETDEFNFRILEDDFPE